VQGSGRQRDQFYNVVDLTEVLSAMVAEGLPITMAVVARLSLYLRDHLLRSGKYAVDMDDLPPALDPRSLRDLTDGRV
jgi:hypothetical protein